MRVASAIALPIETRRRLEKQMRGRSTPVRVAQRSRIVLLAADGLQNKQIAAQMGVAPRMIALWRGRFIAQGLEGLLKDAPRPGRTPAISATIVSEAMGCLNLNPPKHALVLSVDEKSQIQALERTQPGLPMKKGRGQTMTHDYKRNGATTLFAALDTATGEVYGLCQQPRRHQEWLRFLRLIDQTVPADKQIYLICENYATHKHERVQRWLGKHKRFHVRFTPTSVSWLNMVERFFRDITQNRLRRGVFQDLEQLIMAIGEYIDGHNQNPKPFIWTAKANDILEKVTRAKTALNKRGSA